jgi:hypothetical protein
MNAQQAENLRILIRHMETNVHRVLDMRVIRKPCGTPACAWGEACMVPELQPWLGTLAERKTDPVALELVFGCEKSDRMFGFSVNGKADVTPQEWAAEARKVLAENGYSMDDDFARFMAKVQEPVVLDCLNSGVSQAQPQAK